MRGKRHVTVPEVLIKEFSHNNLTLLNIVFYVH